MKLFQSTVNNLKFYAMIYFVKYIWDYSSAINYDTVYNKTVYKYLFKTFYRKTNKKKYKLQILKYNIYYTNIIVMQNVILVAKIWVESAKKKFVVNMPDIMVMRICNITNIFLKYNWYLNLTNNEITINPKLQDVKKYFKYTTQIVDKLRYP